MTLIGCKVICQLKYLWLRLQLQREPAGRPSESADYHGPFPSVVGLGGDGQAIEVFGLWGFCYSNMVACGPQHVSCLVETNKSTQTNSHKTNSSRMVCSCTK